ncbi:hypothetical protein ACOI1H_21605 [Loktanella sp. DJP18]|uniref:hypothetical protein n=1 Tax=Loktanella sp. DJP18 TaxID=3409788 RepID=UPI003BB688F9
MGYTHYYYHTKPLSDDDWDLCVDAFSRIVTDASKDGMKLSEDADGTLSNHQIIARAWHRTDFAHGPVLRINGIGEDSCETFTFWKNAAPRQPWQESENSYNGFMFVKTQRLPYDIVVTAFLCWVLSRLPDALNAVNSDGGKTSWLPGAEMADRIFPDLEIKTPKDLFMTD